MKFLPALLLPLALAACGTQYHLPGHSPAHTAAIPIRVGESLPALSQGPNPLKLGFLVSLSSEDPEIADVQFRNGNPNQVWIVGRKPGTTTFHYGNFFSLTYPFGRQEGRRLGIAMPFDEFERPGAGRGWPRRTWLRTNSLGAFAVRVLPDSAASNPPPNDP
jgi:hypothetical protein